MTVVENASAYVSIYPVDPMPPAIAALRAGTEPVWVFAYGSLMWNPEIAFAEARPGFLHGYHRSFCLYSRDYRGTPERPGLVLGLDRGGSCCGIVYRLPPGRVGETLDRIWAREMTGQVYRMRRVAVRAVIILPTRCGTWKSSAFATDCCIASPRGSRASPPIPPRRRRRPRGPIYSPAECGAPSAVAAEFSDPPT